MLLALCLSVGNVFAQDADKLRADGDAAMNAKNFAVAAEKYGQFLKLTNYEDADRVFNCGYASFQAKKYEDAVKFYDMAIKKKNNLDNAFTGKAMALRNLDKADEFAATVTEGLKVVKNKANLEKLLYGYSMKKAQAAQKAGKFADAEKLYKNILGVGTASYKVNALYSLGAMFYNSGAKLLQGAGSDSEKYAAAKVKALVEFKKAKNYLEEATKLDPKNEGVKKILASIVETMK